MFIVMFGAWGDERHEYKDLSEYLEENKNYIVKFINSFLEEAHPEMPKFELTDECKKFCEQYVKDNGDKAPWYALNADKCSYEHIRLNNLIDDAIAAFLHVE
jgi:hypothetical protein